MPVRIEVCVESADAVATAERAGADRVELCNGLIVGGITPSIGCVRMAIHQAQTIGIHVLIRPRDGDFVYTPTEVETMIADIAAIRDQIADSTVRVGFVLGALTGAGRIDTAICTALIDAAGGAPVSFHRAFDLTEDLDRALDTLRELGFGRVLTGGGHQRALDGAATLARLVQRAEGGIDVMPGGSVRPHNAAQILAATGANDLHFRAVATVANRRSTAHPDIRMASGRAPDEAIREETSAQAVADMISAVRSFAGAGAVSA